MPKSEKTVEQCVEEEKRDIRRRRMIHQELSVTNPLVGGEDHELDRFTGLALSGGGVRSAAFSLGFIQAMYSAGRMKAFDYLSTVSGGGYAGGLFSSIVARETNKIDWERKGTHNRLEFEPLPGGGQPDIVERLSLHGRMMGNFLRLFSRHLWGFLVNISFVASGLFAIAALLAYAMRTPWSPAMAPTLAELRFNSDLTVPFFFTFVLLVLWILSQFVSKIASLLKTEIAPIGLYSYVLLLASVLLGILTMLAIGDIDLGVLIAGNNGDDQLAKFVNQIVRWLGVGISTVFATFLLPYLTPKRLLQSGDPGAGPVQSLIFRAAGNGLIVGAPLFIFFFLVHENISHWNSRRENADQLTSSHLGAPLEFVAYLESQLNANVEPQQELARRIYATLTDNERKEWNGNKEEKEEWKAINWKAVELPHELKQLQKNSDLLRIADAKFGFGSRCLQWLANTTRIDDQFGKRLETAESNRVTQLHVVERFNTRVLSDPSLFDFPKGPNRANSLVASAFFRFFPVPVMSTAESTQPDQLLNDFGLPVGVPKLSSDDRLSHALNLINTSKNQLTTRFSVLEISCPKKDATQKTYASDDHFTFAHVKLAIVDQENIRTREQEVSLVPNESMESALSRSIVASRQQIFWMHCGLVPSIEVVPTL